MVVVVRKFGDPGVPGRPWFPAVAAPCPGEGRGPEGPWGPGTPARPDCPAYPLWPGGPATPRGLCAKLGPAGPL